MTSGTAVESADPNSEAPDDAGIAASLENALDAHAAEVHAVERAVVSLHRAVKAWRAACDQGHMGNRERAENTACRCADELQDALDKAAESWTLDVEEYLRSSRWREEIVTVAAAREGLRVINEEALGQLLSSPIAVQSLPGREALRIGRQNWPKLRPSVVAAELRRLRERVGAAGAQELADRLYDACRREEKDGRAFITFRTAYDLFCLAPDWKKENPPAAFAVALHSLYVSDVKSTRSGKALQWEWPGGKVRPADIFPVRAEDGREMRYYGVWFR